MDDSAAEDDIFKNNHDLIGVQGILRAQKNEIEKKKVSNDNVTYFDFSSSSECKTRDTSGHTQKSRDSYSYLFQKFLMIDLKMSSSTEVPSLIPQVLETSLARVWQEKRTRKNKPSIWTTWLKVRL